MTSASPLQQFSRVFAPIYAAAAMRLLTPLLVLPLMAARLGPGEFGRLSFILVWSGLLSLLVEGGFLAAATRLAVTAEAPRRWMIARRVFTARCALSLAVWPLALAAVAWAQPGATQLPAVEAAGIAALACALGWPATWYLQARQQLARWARVEMIAYGVFVALCVALVHSVAAYVLCHVATAATLATIGWQWLRRDLATDVEGGTHWSTLWAPAELKAGLRLGWTMLPVSIAGAAYSFALPALASSHLPKAELGVYYLADRIVRALLAAADPVLSVVYPRIVRLFDVGAGAALRYALRWAVGGSLIGMAILGLGALARSQLEAVLIERAGATGPLQVEPVLAVLSWLLPLLLGWKFIGYWMLGSGRFDAAYRRCVMVGGIVGVAGAFSVTRSAGAVGLAWVAVGAEMVVIAVALLGIGLTLARNPRIQG